MRLVLHVDGASELELRRGLKAAEAVFERAGVSAERAAEGMFALEGWDIQSFPENSLSDEDGRAASAWIDATNAAVEACIRNRGREQAPSSWRLAFED
ncbi:hypothetical protein GN330_11955 [Nitratireductor sp. CAU 1489]|uniref:Uncharacterized protein n=1 Tax=Nitratireductor arenosus TaxID=2682096 RepID=A0A844QIS9_9HYPH|nr:hypothetical protein [Nitratireductor arenosus]MVA97958.1 hypothetical protein [Nitratireductor arenosus]